MQYVVIALMLFGAVFVLLGSIGLVKFPDLYTRLHAPTKASTLGVGAILTASAIDFSASGQHVSVHEVLVTLFLFITAPIGAYLVAMAGVHRGVDSVSADTPRS